MPTLLLIENETDVIETKVYFETQRSLDTTKDIIELLSNMTEQELTTLKMFLKVSSAGK